MTSDAARITQAIAFLEDRSTDQPELADVAAAVGLSRAHFQRMFKRFAGVSPKRFLQFLTAEHARQILDESRSVLAAAYETGLSGPGRLHDLTVNVHALTPGEIRRGGAGVDIRYGFHPTPFGECLLGITDRGICALAFVTDAGREGAIDGLQARWPHARARRSDASTRQAAEHLFHPSNPRATLDVRGTNFQIRVWEALLRIPEGALVSYADLAASIGRPRAARAVGSAVAKNPIALLIPCHRVIRGTGTFGDYRWGTARKKTIVGWEAAKRKHVPL